MIRAAVIQAGCLLGDHDTNLKHVERHLEDAADAGADLAIFPEAFLTGYLTASHDETREVCLSRADPRLKTIGARAAELGLAACIGFLERDGDRLYNTAGFWDRDGSTHFYRKRHLPHLGADRYVQPPASGGLGIYETTIGRVGIAVCYELRFPEVVRTLALQGAELVLLPTAWPPAGQILADHFTRTRAAENFVYLLAANRHDTERGIRFIGSSSITGPDGLVLAQGHRDEAILVADLEPRRSRDKGLVVEPGEFEIRPWRDRRPQDYSTITSLDTAPPVEANAPRT